MRNFHRIHFSRACHSSPPLVQISTNQIPDYAYDILMSEHFTPKTDRMPIRWLSQSVLSFLGLVLYLVVVKLTITFFPAVFRSTAQAAVFEWKFLAIWAVLGWAGVVLAELTGFPEPWNGGISNSRRLLYAVVIGIGLGVLAIATDLLTGWTHFVAAKMKLQSIHIDFPASLMIYHGGAIIVNILYRIFPIPLLLWLISNLILRKRAQNRVFWILAVLIVFVEPFSDL